MAATPTLTAGDRELLLGSFKQSFEATRQSPTVIEVRVQPLPFALPEGLRRSGAARCEYLLVRPVQPVWDSEGNLVLTYKKAPAKKAKTKALYDGSNNRFAPLRGLCS